MKVGDGCHKIENNRYKPLSAWVKQEKLIILSTRLIGMTGLPLQLMKDIPANSLNNTDGLLPTGTVWLMKKLKKCQ